MADLTQDDIRNKPAPQVEQRLPDEHPASYYLYAMRLFGEGRKEDAVFWFYAGQLRYRFHLAANPQLPRDGDPAVMSALNAQVGEVINGWAGGDPVAWAKQIDRALAWDDKTPNGFTSKQKHAQPWREIRSGLEAMKATIVRDADKIREQRTKAGLPNR